MKMKTNRNEATSQDSTNQFSDEFILNLEVVRTEFSFSFLKKT